MKYTIQVITRTQDNGDGGYTTYAYNNADELIADHPKSRDFVEIDGKYQTVVIELTEEQRNDILNEDDPYENGYIGRSNIEIEVVDGVAKLTKHLSFHAGQ